MTEEELAEIYEDYRDDYFQEAKGNYAEYKAVKTFDMMLVTRNGSGEYNTQVLINEDELEEIAFDNFKKDYENGKITTKEV